MDDEEMPTATAPPRSYGPSVGVAGRPAGSPTDPAPPRDGPPRKERQRKRDKRFRDKTATPSSTPPTRPSKQD
eukprot:11212868-Lingulodinium_polyedra.AAC.1